MNESIIFMLIISVLILLIGNILLISRNISLSKSYDSIKDIEKEARKEVEKTKRTREKILGVEPGDRGIIMDYELCYGKQGEKDYLPFKVTYEVDIVEVSLNKFKVRATGYTTNSKIPDEASKKAVIIDFMKDKWVERDKIEIVIDDVKRRGDKIDQILS